MASPVSTSPLASAITISIVFIIPTAILLYLLWSRDPKTNIVKPTEQTQHVSAIGQNRNAAVSTTSLSSLDVRPFMDSLQVQHVDARAFEYGVPHAQAESKRSKASSDVRSIFVSYILGTLLSLVCGLIYLSCAASGITSKGIKLPLVVSATVIPSLLLPHSIETLFTKLEITNTVALQERWQPCFRLWIPLFASLIVGILGTWSSSYIVLAVLAITLILMTALTFSTAYRWPRSLFASRSRIADANRKTKSWFSGNAISEADAEGLARQGNMPRPGETEEAFLQRMQQEGNSWVTETGNPTLSRSRLMSSFSYATTNPSGGSTPVTPTTPQTAFTRPISTSSARTAQSNTGDRGKDRTHSSQTNSWITEPTDSGTTLSSFRFDMSDDIPPVPALTASTKARYGVPASAITALPSGEEPTFYGEGPSILHIGDPANMTFASYDSLPIKHGKRSTNFEILGPSHMLPKFRSSKSPSATSFRKRSKRALSDESFHSAIDDPCQILDKTRSTRDADQSFPRSVSMSSDTGDVFCDARGSGRDDASLDGDAVETVVDEDELEARTSESAARRGGIRSVDNPQSSSYSSRHPIAERFMSTAPSGKASSSTDIVLPAASIPSRYGTQSDLPQPPTEGASRYSPYSSVASPMFGGFSGPDKKSTDPLLMGGKASSGVDTIDWRNPKPRNLQNRAISGSMAGQGVAPEMNDPQQVRSRWTCVANLLVLWMSFGLAIPIFAQSNPKHSPVQALYLVSIVIPALASFVSCLTLGLVPESIHLGRKQQKTRLRPLILQPSQSGPVGSSEKQQANALLACRTHLGAWARIIDTKLKSLNRNATRGTFEKRLNHLKDGPSSLSRRQYQKDMARRSSEVWLETGQARPSSGRFDRMFSLVAPHPRVSISQPQDRFEMSAIAEVDPDQTPRARPREEHHQLANPPQFVLDDDMFSEYSILNDPARTSLGEYPTSPNRTDMTHSRADSLSSSPGAKSVKLASVHQAIRGRMSLGPTFLIGGSQGDAIITARRSMDLDAALRAELEGHEVMHSRQQSLARPETFIASRASEDQSQFQESNRRSGDILGRPPCDEERQERRRTFDFGKMWSGWRKGSEPSGGKGVYYFEDVDPQRLDAIMMTHPSTTQVPMPSEIESTTAHRRTPGANTSASTIGQANEMPVFRASEDFILPGQRGDEGSIDFGRPSIAPGDQTSFSIDSHATSGTPRHTGRKTSSRGPASGLPEMTAVDFLADFKGAIRDLGTRAEDTPAREAVRYVLSGLATPHAVTKKGSSTSVRSILKNRSSTEPRLTGTTGPIAGHSLPPIPVELQRALRSKGSAISMVSTGRSTPVPELEEQSTSASQTNLFLPPPRNLALNGSKSSVGPHSVVLHPVIKREECGPVPAKDMKPQQPGGSKSLPLVPAEAPADQFLAVGASDAPNAHDRSASTNTAIEEIETIMSMDSPTTASYLQTNFLARPQSVITGRYDGPVSAPAHCANPSFAIAQQSTHQMDPHHPLKSSRSTPAFVVANSWTGSRPTAGASKENSRPGSAYSYLQSELGLPPVPLSDLASVAKRGSLPPQNLTRSRRELLGDVSTNIAQTVTALDSQKSKKPEAVSQPVARSSIGAEEVNRSRIAKQSRSPQKSKGKPRARGSTKPGGGDASVKVMRF